MDQLKRIENLLNENHIPKDVFIGKDSTADRVEWLIRRNKINQERATKRFNTFSDEFAILSTVGSSHEDWMTIDEIAERTGIEREKVQPALVYLAQKGLLDEINDGLSGNQYAAAKKTEA